MWTIIISIVVIYFIFLIIAKTDHYLRFEDHLTFFGGALVVGTIIGLIIAFALPTKSEIIKTTYNLEVLQDNNSMGGNFFLGCGQIEGKMKYVFYYKDSSDFYIMKQINYDEAKIRYSDEKPKIEQLNRMKIKGAFINNFAIDLNFTYQEYIIYVPKETIKQNYLLDAQ